MNWSPDKYAIAWNYASLAHRGQTYGGQEQGMQIEYINHVGSVAMELIRGIIDIADCDADFAIQCALLHDVIEDTEKTYEDILENFGKSVANGVLALSKNKKLPTKGQQMEDSLSRIKQQPREVWMVKMADRITNLYHPPYYWDKERIKAYHQEAILIHENLKESNTWLAQRLWKKIEEYKSFF